MTPQRLRARRSVGGSPKRRAWPAVGWRSPSMRLMEVVLPAPLGPSIATTSPALDREVDAAQRLDGAVPLARADERDGRIWRSVRSASHPLRP